MGVAVSVIVPVYNAQEWIEECVRSVSGQTFRNFELLLVDDGSRDRSGELCDLCAASEPRARVIHTPNGGVTAARACGLREAQGESGYVFLMLMTLCRCPLCRICMRLQMELT